MTTPPPDAASPRPSDPPAGGTAPVAAQSMGPEAAVAPAEWKPEPRQWTWKDLFTAPMLAFKPKCMLVSAATIVVLGLWWLLFDQLAMVPGTWTWQAVLVAWWLVTVVVFSLGACLVAVFMRADLIDDEFLSFGEAFTQYAGRLASALLVPLFLIAIAAGVYLALIYLPMLIGSIPYLGPALYTILYPLGFFMGLFLTLLLIAIALSVFVFPAIIAVRKHGWFDNVVDTIEAVGTKPHVLIASAILTLIMIAVVHQVGVNGMDVLKQQAASRPLPLPGSELALTERRAEEISRQLIQPADRTQRLVFDHVLPGPIAGPAIGGSRASFLDLRDRAVLSATPIDYPWTTRWIWGPLLGGWQALFLVLILGYCLNLLVAGGMLSYLVVREDDYWDDEDLEDLDKLAKELEEEAKREDASAKVGPAATAAPAVKPAEPPPPAT